MRQWYEHDEPESLPIPDYEEKLAALGNTAPFLKALVRSLRLYRTNLRREGVHRQDGNGEAPVRQELFVMGPASPSRSRTPWR